MHNLINIISSFQTVSTGFLMMQFCMSVNRLHHCRTASGWLHLTCITVAGAEVGALITHFLSYATEQKGQYHRIRLQLCSRAQRSDFSSTSNTRMHMQCVYGYKRSFLQVHIPEAEYLNEAHTYLTCLGLFVVYVNARVLLSLLHCAQFIAERLGDIYLVTSLLIKISKLQRFTVLLCNA